MTIGMTVRTGIGTTVGVPVRTTVPMLVRTVVGTGFLTLLASRAGVARAVHNDHHRYYDHHRDKTPWDFCPPARLGPYREGARPALLAGALTASGRAGGRR